VLFGPAFSLRKKDQEQRLFWKDVRLATPRGMG
jgi:hypothetical protein